MPEPSNQLQRAKDLITANPDGPEAEDEGGAGTSTSWAKISFRATAFESLQDTARKQGSPEINLLSPGEAVAIHSYTCGDYAQMNGLLLGIDPLPEYDSSEMANRVLVEPTVDQVKIKNELACAALQKLPDWPGGRTLRGVRKPVSR